MMNSTEKQQKRLLFGEESERLYFKKVDESYNSEWLRFCAFPGSLDYIGLHEHESPEDKCQAWFERVNFRYDNELGGMNALIEKASGKLVGQCGLLIQEIDGVEELEIGYSLMPDFRGFGFALEAAQKCRDHAFENDLSKSLISVIHVENPASMKVARANGMEISTTTISKGDPVHIFRITRETWLQMHR
jgi:ribosomal-protein-alanine N-acetyltransferase